MMNVKDMRPLDENTHSVRTSQAVLQYGVGAMIDFPSQVLMTACPEVWKNCDKIHDERLEKLLGVEYFISPSEKCGIPFVRFPRWYFCPKCRAFKPIETWQKEYLQKRIKNGRITDDSYMVRRLICANDGVSLVPARVVVACENGHIDDFPWVNWVHRKSIGGEKPVCNQPVLKFKTGTSASSGLEGVEIVCESCQARTSLKGAFDKNALEDAEKTSKYGTKFICQGKHPWKNETEDCKLYPRTMQRGASSVYFPRVISSLVIPPYSSHITSKVNNSETYQKILAILDDILDDTMSIEEKNRIINEKINKYVDQLSDEIYEEKSNVLYILQRKLFIIDKEDIEANTELLYKSEEYKALTGKMHSSMFEFDEFNRESVDIGHYQGIRGIKSISLIHKVKEVTALIGFSRIKPTNSMKTEDDSRFVSVKKPNTKFYPASESRGEGIFIEFDKKQLTNFFKNAVLKERAEQLKNKYNASFWGQNKSIIIDAEFLFIHTMAHLLIKELSFHCGYPTASLRERIYYGEAGGENMCGIFLYTTGGDAEGTLGGLVRQGYPDCLPRIINNAIENAKFCANDPVCNESTGQGIDGLNLAACHACALLPETSCEYNNILLDRVVVIGSLDGSVKGFLNK